VSDDSPTNISDFMNKVNSPKAKKKEENNQKIMNIGPGGCTPFTLCMISSQSAFNFPSLLPDGLSE
jgi:hypothetical protein